VKGDPMEGEDGELYAAMGYRRTHFPGVGSSRRGPDPSSAR
jgi:hypothetical protein